MKTYLAQLGKSCYSCLLNSELNLMLPFDSLALIIQHALVLIKMMWHLEKFLLLPGSQERIVLLKGHNFTDLG